MNLYLDKGELVKIPPSPRGIGSHSNIIIILVKVVIQFTISK